MTTDPEATLKRIAAALAAIVLAAVLTLTHDAVTSPGKFGLLTVAGL